MSNIVPFSQQITLAESFAKSGLFGIKTKEQALALMAICEAENLHPAVAVRDYNIIQGRPALKADAMLARFQAAGGSVKWTSMMDDKVSGIFSHPQGGSIEIDWTMARAKTAGLGGKDNWSKYPRQMLRARVISEGIRTVFPGCVAGFYTPEEVQDFTTSAPRDITPTEPETANPNGDEPKPLTIADVRAAAKTAMGQFGKEPVMEVLKLKGWSKAEDIEADRYAEAIAILQEMR